MIYAEIQYDKHYSEFHTELLELIEDNFTNIESGLQGDSWIWITDGNEKVAIDTFTSMKHQIKSSNRGSSLVTRVIDVLKKQYTVKVNDEPE